MLAMSDKLDVKLIKLEHDLETNKEEQQKFFDISFKRNENYIKLGGQFHEHRMSTAELFKHQRNEINDQLVKHDAKLKKMHFYKEQLAQQIDNHRVEMKSEWHICTQEILDKLEVQENRMQEIEIRHLAVLEFQKKFSEFQIKV